MLPATLTYSLTEDLWRRFYEAHYAADPTLRIRYFWGVICIIIGALGFGGVYDSRLIAALLILTGFYGVLSRPILLLKSLAAARKHPHFQQEIAVELSLAGVMVKGGQTGYQMAWKDFTGYREVRAGFMLYLDRQAFFFIPRAACSAEEERRLQQLLRSVELPKRG